MNEMILTLNLKEGLFTLDENTLNALGRPRQVQLLINVKKCWFFVPAEQKTHRLLFCPLKVSSPLTSAAEHCSKKSAVT